LMGCQHYFCKNCLKEYAEDLINKGEIGKLVCPFYKSCETLITETNLRDIGVKEEIIEKVTIFSINQAIERMEDFGWCPISECAAPAEIDKVKNFGRCTHCNFTFCLTCREKAHFFK